MDCRAWGLTALMLASSGAAQPLATYQLLDQADGYLTPRLGAISPDGRMLAGSLTPPLGPHDHLFRWTVAGGYEVLPDSNSHLYVTGMSADGSVIVGGIYFSTPQQDGRPFRWTAANGYEVLHPTDGGWANGVSADGSVVIGRIKVDTQTHAFRWTRAGGIQDLGLMFSGDRFSTATVINSPGTIIAGTSGPSASDALPFKWTSSGGFVPYGYYVAPYFYGSPVAMTPDGAVMVGFEVQNYAAYRPAIWRQPSSFAEVFPAPQRGPIVNNDFLTAITADGQVMFGTSTYGGWLVTPGWGAQDLRLVLEVQGAVIPTLDDINAAGLYSTDGRTVAGGAWHDTGLGYLESRIWRATLDPRRCVSIARTPGAVRIAAWSRVALLSAPAAAPAQTMYRWRKDGQPLSPNATHSTVTDNRYLFLVSPTEADAGSYDCVATAPCGTEVSAPITVSWYTCRADQNLSGDVTVQDIFEYLSAYFVRNNPDAEVDGRPGITLQDLFDFLGHYFAAC